MNVSLSPGDRIIFFALAFLTVSISPINLTAQLARSTWAHGSSANYSSSKSPGFEINGLTIEPTIGYFFADRLAGGFALRYAWSKTKYPGGKTIQKLIGIGPFVRYYFLPQQNSLNVLTAMAFEFGRNGSPGANKLPFRTGWIGLGPTYFFNESVAIELLAKYRDRVGAENLRTKTVVIDVGFQIFLERDE